MKNLIQFAALLALLFSFNNTEVNAQDRSLSSRFRRSSTAESPSRWRTPAKQMPAQPIRVARDLPIEIDSDLKPFATNFGPVRSTILSPQDVKDEIERQKKAQQKIDDLSARLKEMEELQNDLEELDDLNPLDDLDPLESTVPEDISDDSPPFEEFGMWPRKNIRDIRVDIRETSLVVPKDQSYQLRASLQRRWTAFAPTQKIFAWEAPDIRYKPLYFEDVALERYGQTFECSRFGLQKQELASFAHFFKSAVLYPYQAKFDPPKSCETPLGYCRPGNRVPYFWQTHLGWGKSRY